MILVLGKAGSLKVPNLGRRGFKSPGLLDVLPKSSAEDIMREQACCYDEVASPQLPVAVASESSE